MHTWMFVFLLTAGITRFSFDASALEGLTTSDTSRAEAPSTALLPSGPPGPGRFGAYYTRLAYDPEWDKDWRVGPFSDVVVRFEKAGYRLVFWRGTNFIPCWVTDNNIWYTNEFTETWETIGSSEPMSDKQCRYSHVRIIESHPARVIVHWRYALNDVAYRIAWPDSATGWGDWCDEYYILYPDGVGIRKVVLYSSHWWKNDQKQTDDAGHEWQEGIVVYNAGSRPEESLETDAVHVANMKGEVGKWSWDTPGKPVTPTPEGSCIVLMNVKSKDKPFVVSPPGCRLDAYEGCQNGSRFRWRDHWPTTLEPTPGRDANGKQAAHGSFFHLTQIPIFERGNHWISKIMLHGMTPGSVAGLVPMVKSWLNAPGLGDVRGCESRGYDPAQRAYVLQATGRKISFDVQASADSPLINPAFVIKNWNQDAKATVRIRGHATPPQKSFLQGVVPELDGSRTLILWGEMHSEGTIHFEIKAMP